jgi:hypothetical protein
MSFDPKDAETGEISDLGEKELKVLDDWLAKLSQKYPQVGVLA